MGLAVLSALVVYLATQTSPRVWIPAVAALVLFLGVYLWVRRVRLSEGEKFRVAFVHPDLGIGGAERLVVDAAVGLQQLGHSVVMYTSHHDPKHAFAETADGTLVVKVHGDFFPRSVFGRLHILFATIRGVYLAIVMVMFEPRYDVLVVDQLSIPNPFLRLTGSRIVFYCHFPDLKLSGSRGALKAAYRLPFDLLEEWTTLLADVILVNSRFTARVFRETFRSAVHDPTVLYPSINLAAYDEPPPAGIQSTELYRILDAHATFVSINRFERKKDVGKAVRAFALLAPQLGGRFRELRLVLAGGYDPRVSENVEHKRELEELAASLGVRDQVIFKPSFTSEERSAMLSKALAVVYTPANEHFGIVPVEGMYAERPVIACNNGGPTESILDGETGILCEDTPEAFAQAMIQLLSDRGRAAAMGRAGRERVRGMFSLESFAARLDTVIRNVVSGGR